MNWENIKDKIYYRTQSAAPILLYCGSGPDKLIPPLVLNI
jgi:hypothetical protein